MGDRTILVPDDSGQAYPLPYKMQGLEWGVWSRFLDDQFGGCVACGVMVLPENLEDEPENSALPQWLREVVLVHLSKVEIDESTTFEETPACVLGGPYYAIGHDREKELIVAFHDETVPSYFPFHTECLKIAKKVVSYNCTLKAHHDTLTTSIPQLIDIYRRRAEDQESTRGFDQGDKYDQRAYWPTTKPYSWIMSPVDYYGAPEPLHEEMFKDGQIKEPFPRYIACPHPITNLTQTVLSYLQPLPAGASAPKDSAQQALHAKLDHVPQEMYDHVVEQLTPLKNPPLECTRTVPSWKWRDLLFSGALPWLWDLDASILTTRRSPELPPYNDDHAWDWEQLVRSLAQVGVFEEGGLIAGAPLGLRNRRRIWRLVDEARLGDCDPDDD